MYRTLSHHVRDATANVPNLHVVPSEPITYRGITMTLNYLTGMSFMLFRNWRHVIQREHTELSSKFEEIVMEEEDQALCAPVIGAAMAIKEEMREHINNNCVLVRSLTKYAWPLRR